MDNRGPNDLEQVKQPVPSSDKMNPFDQTDECPSGNDPAKLSEIEGLNWGAFLMNWIWLIPINTTWAVITFVVIFALNCLAGLGSVVQLVLAIYLLLKGNRFAWKFRPFRDVEEFKAVQAAWLKWGIILLAAGLLIGIGVAVLFGGFIMAILAGGSR